MILQDGPGPGAVLQQAYPERDVFAGDVVVFDGTRQTLVVADPVLGPRQDSPLATEFESSAFTGVKPSGPRRAELDDAGIALGIRPGDLVSEFPDGSGRRWLASHTDVFRVTEEQLIARPEAGLALTERGKLAHPDASELTPVSQIGMGEWIALDGAGAEPVQVLATQLVEADLDRGRRSEEVRLLVENPLGIRAHINVHPQVEALRWPGGIPQDPFGPWGADIAHAPVVPEPVLSVPDHLFEDAAEQLKDTGWGAVQPGSVIVAGSVHKVELQGTQADLQFQMLQEPVVVLQVKHDVAAGATWVLTEQLDVDAYGAPNPSAQPAPERAWILANSSRAMAESRILLGQEQLPVPHVQGTRVPAFEQGTLAPVLEHGGRVGPANLGPAVVASQRPSPTSGRRVREVDPLPVTPVPSGGVGME